jgi:glucokinase
LLHGAIGRAGHLGHMTVDAGGAPDITGTPGSLEDAIGDATVRSRTGLPSTQALLEAVASGDAAASACWHQSVRALAAAMASLGNIIDPEAFVIAGGIASAGPRLFEPLDEFLSGMEWRPAGHRFRVLPAELGEWAGAVGAAHAASSPTIDL